MNLRIFLLCCLVFQTRSVLGVSLEANLIRTVQAEKHSIVEALIFVPMKPPALRLQQWHFVQEIIAPVGEKTWSIAREYAFIVARDGQDYSQLLPAKLRLHRNARRANIPDHVTQISLSQTVNLETGTPSSAWIPETLPFTLEKLALNCFDASPEALERLKEMISRAVVQTKDKKLEQIVHIPLNPKLKLEIAVQWRKNSYAIRVGFIFLNSKPSRVYCDLESPEVKIPR